MRYYVGVDWADQTHAVWVVDESGTKITARTVPHTAAGFVEWGRELDEWRAQGIERWAAIERPDGRVVDFLLDHGVVVYPVNPKALNRARDRFRQSGAKSDPFDARVLADFLRTDHPSGSPAFLSSTGEVVGIVLEGQKGRTATISVATPFSFLANPDGTGKIRLPNVRMENV